MLHTQHIILLTQARPAECALVDVPESIIECKRLQRLWLSENRIRALPEAMSQMSSLNEIFLQA